MKSKQTNKLMVQPTTWLTATNIGRPTTTHFTHHTDHVDEELSQHMTKYFTRRKCWSCQWSAFFTHTQRVHCKQTNPSIRLKKKCFSSLEEWCLILDEILNDVSVSFGLLSGTLKSQKGKWRGVRWFTLNLPLKQMLMAIMAISVYPVYPHLAVQLPVLLEGQHTAASAANQIGALWGSPGHPPRMARAARWQMEWPESTTHRSHRWNKQKPVMCLG